MSAVIVVVVVVAGCLRSFYLDHGESELPPSGVSAPDFDLNLGMGPTPGKTRRLATSRPALIAECR